jgi:Flp pilus assembly protein TadD
MTRRLSVHLVLVALAIIGLTTAAQAQKVQVAPGVTVTRKIYPAPANEAPFFNFTEKTAHQKAADDSFVTEALKRVPDRAKAAQMTVGAGWQALMGGDFATAARRFNQAFLLDPKVSGIYHGFAAVAASRFRDFDFADELFRIAAGLNSPARTLSADHGRILLMAGRPREAKPLLERAVGDNPDWAVPKSNLAMAVLQMGDTAEACRLAAQVTGRDLASVERDLGLLKQQANCR